jgi:nucleoside-diphosphate-sugar epimerase
MRAAPNLRDLAASPRFHFVQGDGSSARDHTYVTDIVNDIMAATPKKFGFEIFNLSGAEPPKVSIKEGVGRYVAWVRRSAGVPVGG